MLFFVLNALSVARHALEADARFGPTKNWNVARRASPSATLDVTVALKTADAKMKSLEATFWAVSDPDHVKYGQHLKSAEVTALMRNDEIDKVVGWLREGGAAEVVEGTHADTVEAVLSVGVAERLLEATFYEYVHALSGEVTVRIGAGGYSVPSQLSHLVAMIEGIGRLPAITGPTRVFERADGVVEEAGTAAAGGGWPTDCAGGLMGGCKDKVTPAVLAQRYALPLPPLGSQVNGSSLAVAEFQGQVWDQKDLSTFGSKCGLRQKVTVDHEAGKVSKGTVCKIPVFGVEACGEALLDIEFAKAVCGDIPLTDVYASNYNLLSGPTRCLRWRTASSHSSTRLATATTRSSRPRKPSCDRPTQRS